nr:PREDICTED: thyroid receptor-interacting protein 11-like [Equus przewalskii]
MDENQLEELLREQDMLKQRVNVLEEWQWLDGTCEAACSQEAIKSEVLGESSKGPPAEMEALRRATEEKDAAIRSLQEETQRLSEAMAATSERERERHAQTDSSRNWRENGTRRRILKFSGSRKNKRLYRTRWRTKSS